MRTIPKRKSNFPEYYNRIVLNQKAYIRSNICFFGGKMRRIWGYTLFWFAMGMLLMYIVGGGIIGIPYSDLQFLSVNKRVDILTLIL